MFETDKMFFWWRKRIKKEIDHWKKREKERKRERKKKKSLFWRLSLIWLSFFCRFFDFSFYILSFLVKNNVFQDCFRFCSLLFFWKKETVSKKFSWNICVDSFWKFRFSCLHFHFPQLQNLTVCVASSFPPFVHPLSTCSLFFVSPCFLVPLTFSPFNFFLCFLGKSFPLCSCHDWNYTSLFVNTVHVLSTENTFTLYSQRGLSFLFWTLCYCSSFHNFVLDSEVSSSHHLINRSFTDVFNRK